MTCLYEAKKRLPKPIHSIGVDKRIPIPTGSWQPDDILSKNLESTKLIIASISVNDDKTRYERLLTRRREQERHLNIEDFIIEDRHREGVPNNYENDKLSAIIDSAAYKIENDGDLNRFED